MKTQKQKLDFRKRSITELNDGQLLRIEGGTTVPCAAASSDRCLSLAVTLSIVIWTFTDSFVVANDNADAIF